MIDDMAVYIANLGKYNEGYLVGAWFTFPIDEEDVKEKIGLNEQYEEYAIHDTDNFPIAIGEYVSIEELNEMYEMIEELPDYIVECLDEFISHYGTLEEVVEHKDDIYYYPDCETMTDVAYYYIDELQALGDIPPSLQNYIDYEAYGRDLDNPIDKQDFLNGESCIVQYEGSEIPKEYLNQRVFFNLQGKQYEITVEAVSYDTQYSGRDIGASLIVSQDYLNSLISKPTTLNMYIYYNQKYDEVLEKKITSLVEDSPYSNDLHIESQFENMRTIQESQGEMMEIGTIIALLLLLVGVLNYTNTIASSIQNRKLTFSVMESIGMSKKQINQLLIREGVLYALFSVFITLTIGSVITYICFESMNYMEIPFNIPVIPLISAIILVMLICMITPLLSYKKLAGNRSIVERLRDYE